MRKHVAAFLGVSLVVPAARAGSTGYHQEARVAYLQSALVALFEADAKKLKDAMEYIDVMARNNCRSVFHNLRVNCLVEAARRSCRGRRSKSRRRACNAYSDVVIANKLGESSFVTTERRYAIMRDETDFRTVIRTELWRHYGSMAADYVLWSRAGCDPSDAACLAKDLDAYCLMTADIRNLSWQHCASAIAWFIGTAAKSE